MCEFEKKRFGAKCDEWFFVASVSCGRKCLLFSGRNAFISQSLFVGRFAIDKSIFSPRNVRNATERRHVWNYVHVPGVTVSVFNRHQVASLICFSPKRNEVLLMEMVEIKAVRSCRKCQ